MHQIDISTYYPFTTICLTNYWRFYIKKITYVENFNIISDSKNRNYNDYQ